MKKTNCIEFSLLFTGGFSVLTGYTENPVWTKLAVSVSFKGLLLPVLFQPLAWDSLMLGKRLSYFSSTALLTIIFFLVVCPVALLRKLFSKVY